MRTIKATVRLVLKRNRKNKQGEYPIYLVVCWKGDRVEKATGITCKISHWDAKREQIKNATSANKLLYALKGTIEARRQRFEEQMVNYTTSMLLSDSEGLYEVNSKRYVDVYKRVISERRLLDGTIKRYDYTYRLLCGYLSKDDFNVDELSLGVVKDFCRYLECRIKTNTIKSVLACISSVWNYAISKKIVTPDNYPFNEFKHTQKYKECHRDYYLEKEHMLLIRDYFFNLAIKRNGDLWSYKDGAFERLHKRYTKEFALLWFIMCYKMNGSSPIDLALIKPTDCKRIMIDGEDYWGIDIKRKKTNRDVHIRLKRDILTIIGFEHFLGLSDKYVYPIINDKKDLTDKQLICQSHHQSKKAIKWLRSVLNDVNGIIAHHNAENKTVIPQIESERVVLYTARHSFASHYLNSENSTVSGLASLLARSPNTIATYVHQLNGDKEIADMVKNLPI